MSSRKSRTKQLNLKPMKNWLNKPHPLHEILLQLSDTEKAELSLYIDDKHLELKKDYYGTIQLS
jgi:hypothetical protein